MPRLAKVGESCGLQHLDKTPNEYIRWRYALGEDRESIEKATRQISEEEEKKMAQQIKMDDGVKRVLDKVLSRRKAKRSYEYEVSWKDCTSDENSWLTRDKCAGLLKFAVQLICVHAQACTHACECAASTCTHAQAWLHYRMTAHLAHLQKCSNPLLLCTHLRTHISAC